MRCGNIKGFEPWGWIIGTGIYVEDVRTEIDQLSSRVIGISAAIVITVVLLLLFILQQSLGIERRRRKVEIALDESHEKYRALVEAATDGTILLLDGRCTYANNVILEKLGYGAAEFALLDVADVVERVDTSGDQAADPIVALRNGEVVSTPFEARLRGKDGKLYDVVLSVSRIAFAGRQGLILSARDLSGDKLMEEALDVTRQKYRALTETLDLGVFHAEMQDGGTLIDLNPAGRRILGIAIDGKLPKRRLLDFFSDREGGSRRRRRRICSISTRSSTSAPCMETSRSPRRCATTWTT